ncbi:Villin-1 [Acorus calamus]|uniref:Villin-1 n=1 Tax=Acorus calamus TaxID=4465 RepID=A0AAV9DEP6_ACOCL|nr:Villin-1 [Acorus calamus]
MSQFGEGVDDAFRGVGTKPGLEVWCIDNLGLVPIPKSAHGKFFSGSSYIVLNTVLLKSGVAQHDIHYWLGKDAKDVDSALASDKAVELDGALGSRTVQYREIQGFETEKFLSYFRPCVIPIEGVFSSELEGLNRKSYRVSLLACKGDHVIRIREVPFSRSSLNHDDVFVLDTESKIFLFCGCNSSTQERAKALEVVQYIKDSKHGGRCDMATIEDGKFVGDSDAGEFWSLFGGYAPIARDSPCSHPQQHMNNLSAELFWINKEKLCSIGTSSFKKGMLSMDKCYMLDCTAEIYIWMGRNTSITERKKAISATEDFVHFQDRSKDTHITFLTEGSETALFKSYFDDWPQNVVPKLYEEGRGKVAAIFKRHGFDVKEIPDDDSQIFIDCSGNLKVWRVESHDISLIPVAEQTKLYTGDCYILQYIYPVDEKEEHLIYAWLGSNSTDEDRTDAISHMSTLAQSMRGNPVLAQIYEGEEPMQFFAVCRTLIVLKGGMSSRYRSFMSKKGIADKTFGKDQVTLFRVQGISSDNMQAIQVNPVSGSLNSSYCYILQDGDSIFSWTGNLSSPSDHDILDRMLDVIYPSKQSTSIREGSEAENFWSKIGGKAEYPKEKKIRPFVDDPNLFTCTFTSGDFKLKEIFNFTQDDLTTEDVLILDCHNEIYVWVGQHSSITFKEAFKIGKKFLEADILSEGLSLEIAIYFVMEGDEPPFFTRFFNWDFSKKHVHGNSFERKLTIMKGLSPNMETPKRTSRKLGGRNYSETLPDHSRRPIGSDGMQIRSRSPAYKVQTTGSEALNSQKLSSPTPGSRKLFPRSPAHASDKALFPQVQSLKDSTIESRKVEERDSSFNKIRAINYDYGIELSEGVKVFPYERLTVNSVNPAAGIDVTKREAYLCEEEFLEKFGMTKKTFYELPKWRQNKQKISLNLF